MSAAMKNIEHILSHTDASDLARARAEVGRLRVALEKIADPLTLEMPGYVGTELAMKLILRMQTIAKDALTHEQSGDANG